MPVLSVVIGREVPKATTTCRFSSVESALGALVHTVDYGTWLREPDTGLSFVVPGPTGAATRTGAEGWLDTTSASRLVSENGLTLPPQRVAEDAEDAVAAAAEIGYPVVVKLAAADVVHKTEAHGVWPGLRDATDVRCAAAALLDLPVSGGLLLVQREVSGPALAVGLTQDARFGPLLMIASGGTSLDLWGDQVFLMPPLRRGEIRDALRTLRTWPLLTGFRGSVPVDLDAVLDLVDTVGRRGLTRPDIVELDLNPVICTADGPVCVDVKVRRG